MRLVVFTDLECPFCRELDATLVRLLRAHPRDVALSYRHFPLDFHRTGRIGALAAECAAADDRFEDFVHHAFVEQAALGVIPWTRMAWAAGVRDTARFRDCLAREEGAPRIARDVAAGRTLRFDGTPAVIIGDSMYVGAIPFGDLERLLRLR